MKNKKYTVGIDLGTTNCTIAYSLNDSEKIEIHQLAITQLIDGTTLDEKFSLPSFLYYPLLEESVKIPANNFLDEKLTVGLYAKNRGSEMPHRLISSAKSWLCHTGIDRKASLLPLTFEEADLRLSPLKVTSLLLQHLRFAWNQKMKKDAFDDQKILITVPASFDPSARELVLEAAKMAGYPDVTLLEEPQSAFYAWLHFFENEWRKKLKVDDTILVVDIGGGTTDFSLISVIDDSGNLALKRIAVGTHLLLGGDNIDLSLAYFAKEKLENDGHMIDDWQIQALTHAARNAKEVLFSENPPKKVDITILGRGKKLIGNSLKATITLDEAKTLILDGFMPIVDASEQAQIEKRLALSEVGLAFAKDARITAQLAKFLSLTGEGNSSSENLCLPTKVLFNGGTMKSKSFQDRILEQLNAWAKALNKSEITVLEGSDLDFAVSVGAVFYGLSCEGKAVRIKSGASRSYYVGVEEAMPAIPGIKPNLKAICIVPFGMEEGTEQKLETQEFALVVGEPACFRFFSHATATLSNDIVPNMGTVVKNWKQELTELPLIEANLDKVEGDGKVIYVKLKSRMTELSVLELFCESADGRQWKLEFETRES